MVKALTKIRDGLLAVLYPTPCRVCGAPVEFYPDGVACAACWQQQELFLSNLCARCGLPLQSTPPIDTPERCCHRCADFSFAAARACGAYRGALRASVLYLKTQPFLAGRLRRMIGQTFDRSPALHRAEVILPVPLHRGRERERGYNQAALIAAALRQSVRLPVDQTSLARVKATARHRAGLDSQDRARSVRGAFSVTRPGRIDGKFVLLVDDVFTTGSTLNECAALLRRAGAADVLVFTLARVV